MYEADVVSFIWQIERSSSLSDIIDLRDHDQVKRMKDSGTILENVYVPLSWRQIRDENEDQDECARAVDVPCICRQSKRKRKVSDLEKEVAFLYHTDSSKAYVVVNKNELKIIRRLHGKTSESFEIYNGRDEDIVFTLSLREEKTYNVISSRPMPVSVIVRSLLFDKNNNISPIKTHRYRQDADVMLLRWSRATWMFLGNARYVGSGMLYVLEKS